MTPQLIYLCLVFMSLGINISEHGKIEEKPKNAWYSILSISIGLGLLYWGGFFDCLFK